MPEIDSNSKPMISVKKIKCLSFAIRESFYEPEYQEMESFIDHTLGFNTEVNYADFILKVYYAYPHSQEKKVIEIEVETVFHITELEKFIKNAPPVTTENMNVPSEILINMLSLSISHTRALLSENLSGTNFSNYILPIMDSVSLAKHFFGDKVDDSKYK